MGVVERGLVPRPVVTLANRARQWSLWVLPVASGCCSAELDSALRSPRLDAERLGMRAVDEPSGANVLVVAGAVTPQAAASISAALDQLPHPRYVVAVGACACSGGPFAAQLGGGTVAFEGPVDVWVPGCPPRPEAILDGLQLLGAQIATEDPADRWRRAAVPAIGVDGTGASRFIGAERVAERQEWTALPLVLARLDDSGSTARAVAIVEAIEALAGVDVPEAARWGREVLGDLTALRHLTGWHASLAHILELPVADSLAWRARELVADRLDALTGNRVHADAVCVGGLSVGIDRGWMAETDALLEALWDWAQQTDRLLYDVPVIAEELRGLGSLDATAALGLGLTGPNARGSGLAEPTDDDTVPAVHGDGDAFARGWLRLQDARRCCRSLRDRLRHGPPAVAAATTGLRAGVPAGETSVEVPHPEGSLLCTVVSDGTGRPWRVALRGPETAARSALSLIARRTLLDDRQKALVALSLGLTDGTAAP